MKHIRYIVHVFIACFALLLCPLHAENDLTEAEMDSLAMKFYSWEKGNGDNETPNQQNPISHINKALESNTQSHEYTIIQDENNPSYINKIILIVKENVHTAISSYIIRYAHDIHNTFGCSVDIFSVNGETAPQIRNLLISHAENLNGVVLIGDISHINFFHPDSIVRGDTIWKEETFRVILA